MNYEIGDMTLYCEKKGSGNPILFIHGFPLNHTLWSPVSEILKEHYTCIMPDLRGHGKSSVSDSVTISEMASDLHKLLDKMKIDKPVTVCGLSMGGYVTFEFIRQNPKRVSHVILADTRANADDDAKKQERKVIADKVSQEGSKIVADGMITHLFADNAPQNLKDEWQKKMAQTPKEGMVASLLAMADRRDSNDFLSEIKVPTLLVVGNSDLITPPNVHELMHEKIPNSKLEIIKDAGHMTPVESTDIFARLVREFLQ